MFLDELEKVLKNIPYNVWDRVVGEKVDRVNVERHTLPYSGERPRIVVYVHAGITNYCFPGLASLDERTETLLRCWEPYRQLVEREIEKYLQVLNEPTEFIKVEFSEKQFDNLLSDYASPWEKGQLGHYISCFHLKPFLKESCIGKASEIKVSDQVDKMEQLLREEAFSCVSNLVKAWIRRTGKDGQVPESVAELFKEYGVEVSDEMISELRVLAKYCAEAMKYDDDETRPEVIIRRFLSQKLCIKDLYEEADRIVKDALRDCSVKEKKYCYALGVGKRIRRDVLTLSEPKLIDGWQMNGRNYYAIGLRSGYFYSHCECIYNLYINWDKERADKLLDIIVTEDRNEVIDELIGRVVETKDAYHRDNQKKLEECEIERSEEQWSSGNIYYRIRIPEFDITYEGFDKEKEEEKLCKNYEFDRSTFLIRKYLEL